tara:strand:- start:277 stop:1044 length:768 start_codon:yes stop_codon:yes gene_type:complete
MYNKFRLFLALSIIILFFFAKQSLALCDCSTTIPKDLRLKKLHFGTGYTQYEDVFIGIAKEDPLFEQLFKIHVAKFNNITGSIIKFKNGQKEVYRSAILSENIALLSELVKERNIKTIVVLTTSKIFNINPWIDKERSIFSALGGTQFLHILDFDSHFNIQNESEVHLVNAMIVSIVKLITNADSNVLIHCLGGEHKTELVFEVMQKCLNKVDVNNIIQRYKCHTGWVNNTNPGGFRENNVKFILDFPCDLINDI